MLRREIENNTGLVPGVDFPMLNCVSCRPPGNRNPYVTELKACRPWLRLNVTTIQPKLVLLVGTVAAEQFLKKSLVKTRGILIESSGAQPEWLELLPDTKYYHIYHPSYIVRQHNRNVEMLWRGDIASFGEEVETHANF